MVRPSLVLVGGMPAAGKTTLAHLLGRSLGMPVISRDEIKEGLIHAAHIETVLPRGGPIAEQAFTIFYQVVGTLIASSVSVVAEATFHRGVAEANLQALLDASDARLIHCHLARSVSRDRFAERAGDRVRRFAHPDEEILAEMASDRFDWEGYEPLDLGIPLLMVDTTNGYRPSQTQVALFASGSQDVGDSN
jgi:predicted kinase